MFLIQLKTLAERNIPLVAIYLSDPWIKGKFQDLIQVGYIAMKKKFWIWKIMIFWLGKYLLYQISQMEEYLQTIEEKEKWTILDDLIISLSISLQ